MTVPVNPAMRLISVLDDPLRFSMIRHLMAGPATVSELVAHTGAAQSKVSNHLALMRAAHVVETERVGRHVSYGLVSPSVAAVVEAIEAASGAFDSTDCVPEIALARSCYDHIAGRLGVALFRSLVEREAVRDVVRDPGAGKVRSGLGDVALGRRAREVFGSEGIDVDAVAAGRRRFASACNDWTESQPHLGGALGAALQDRLLAIRWVQRRGGTRALRVTAIGRSGFLERFGIDIPALAMLASPGGQAWP